jgi:chorismate-pyruvate lyase
MSKPDLDLTPRLSSDFAGHVLAARDHLNAALLASDSATLTLESWCGAPVTARRLGGGGAPADPGLRARLGAGPLDEIVYRHVELICGGKVLSRAENWYLPSRLTETMRGQLATTDAAFGRVILPLEPARRTTGVRMLFEPPPELTALPPGTALFEHRAQVATADGTPLAEVVETYFSEALPPSPVG